MITNSGLEIIKSHEGLRLTAYKCPAGYWTIGYGCRIREASGKFVDNSCSFDDLPVKEITKDSAEKIILERISEFEIDVKKHFKNIEKLNDNQYSALICLVYNCGISTIGSGLKNLIENDPNNFDAVEKIWLKYNKSGGKVMSGLTKRRIDEFNLYKTQVKPESFNIVQNFIHGEASINKAKFDENTRKTAFDIEKNKINESKNNKNINNNQLSTDKIKSFDAITNQKYTENNIPSQNEINIKETRSDIEENEEFIQNGENTEKNTSNALKNTTQSTTFSNIMSNSLFKTLAEKGIELGASFIPGGSLVQGAVKSIAKSLLGNENASENEVIDAVQKANPEQLQMIKNELEKLELELAIEEQNTKQAEQLTEQMGIQSEMKGMDFFLSFLDKMRDKFFRNSVIFYAFYIHIFSVLCLWYTSLDKFQDNHFMINTHRGVFICLICTAFAPIAIMFRPLYKVLCSMTKSVETAAIAPAKTMDAVEKISKDIYSGIKRVRAKQ
ncbi:lysozyme [Candidatus Deianiraea vastatrix]|uniref:Lysozyme n=1 Tax=Candidatus Deianiraea vastatrix TaxID=2163644 RepID=A0A5B8XF76_9RICK|nr:lysozyme [Candidatus Deianiraea vastatrix]QED23942.1 Putative phage-related lysozyme [Candidatus Deianiraea vastatrix]